MTEKLVTRWKCRRCATEVELDGNAQPQNWVRISRAMPPRHAEPMGFGDLCPPCWGKVQGVLNGDLAGPATPTLTEAITEGIKPVATLPLPEGWRQIASGDVVPTFDPDATPRELVLRPDHTVTWQ